MRVPVEVRVLEPAAGGRPGMCLSCTRCGHEVEVQGCSERARNYGFVRLKEECPEGERNFYVSEGDDE